MGVGAGDAKFGPSAAHTLVTAVSLMRMMATVGGPDFLQRSGMLLRCLHVCRRILAACPATYPVRVTA